MKSLDEIIEILRKHDQYSVLKAMMTCMYNVEPNGSGRHEQYFITNFFQERIKANYRQQVRDFLYNPERNNLPVGLAEILLGT